MAKYLVQAPDSDTLVVSGLYGVHKFKHNSFCFSDDIAKAFPQYFFLIPEENKEESPVLEKKVEDKTEPKKKAGRPKKKG